jgi:prevent-host-death family protein
MKASEFKAKCLALMDEVTETGEDIIVTKHGKPVAKLVPYQAKPKCNPFGILKDDLIITGDIMSPIDVEWDAMK